MYTPSWVQPSPRPKRYLDRLCRFCGAHDQDRPTDRQTDYPTPSVAIGRIYVYSTTMRPNNTFIYRGQHNVFAASTLLIVSHGLFILSPPNHQSQQTTIFPETAQESGGSSPTTSAFLRHSNSPCTRILRPSLALCHHSITN